MVEKEHHVAWADRVGLTKIWFTDMQVCSANFGMAFYPIAVERFENDIINIRNGPALKDKIVDYKKNILDPLILNEKNEWIKNHLQQAQNQSYLRDIEMVLKQKKAKFLLNFILQLLEDNGFGMYKGEYSGEYDKWE